MKFAGTDKLARLITEMVLIGTSPTYHRWNPTNPKGCWLFAAVVVMLISDGECSTSNSGSGSSGGSSVVVSECHGGNCTADCVTKTVAAGECHNEAWAKLFI